MSVALYIYEKILSATSSFEDGIEEQEGSISGYVERRYDTTNFPPDYYSTGPITYEEEVKVESSTSFLAKSIIDLYGVNNFEGWRTVRKTDFTYSVRPPVAILESTSTTIKSTFIVVPNLNYPWNLSECLRLQQKITSILSGADYHGIKIPTRDAEVTKRSRKKWIFLSKDSFSLSLLYQAITFNVLQNFPLREIMHDFAIMRLSAKGASKLAYTIPSIYEDWGRIYPIANKVAPIFSALNSIYCGALSMFPPDIVLKDLYDYSINTRYKEALNLIYSQPRPSIPAPSVEEIVVLQRNSYYYPVGPYAVKRIEEIKFSPSGAQISRTMEQVQKESVVRTFPLLRQRLEPEKSPSREAVRIPLPTASWDCVKKGEFSIYKFSVFQKGILEKPPCKLEELETLVSMIYYPKFSFTFEGKSGQYKMNAQIQTTVSR